MSAARILPVLFIFLLAMVPASAAEPAALQAWFVDSLTKVFPGDAPGAHRLGAPEFIAARNQHLSIQLALRSPAAIEDIFAEISPLKGTRGEHIAGAIAHAVGLVVVGSHTKNTPSAERIGEAPGWFPDPLWDFPVALERNRTRSLWATIHVPADAVPGLYRGAILLRAGKRPLKRVEFRIRVFG
ncbi:MAG TPA: hypothetical protein VF451_03520, partial [Acidobacteriota bacterium]